MHPGVHHQRQAERLRPGIGRLGGLQDGARPVGHVRSAAGRQDSQGTAVFPFCLFSLHTEKTFAFFHFSKELGTLQEFFPKGLLLNGNLN